MISFLADRPDLRPIPAACGLSTLAAILLLAAAPLQAQNSVQQNAAPQKTIPQKTGAPVRLTPPISLVPGAQPAQQPGAQPGATKATVPSAETVRGLGTAPQPAPRKKGIEIDSLSDVDPNSIGAIDAERGGLGADLWKNSQRDTVAGLLRAMPKRIASPTLRDLVRRSLLSVAEPPAERQPDGDARVALNATAGSDAGLAAGQGAGPPGFLSLRAEALSALGEAEGLKQLLAVVPSRDVDEGISRVQVETLMLLQEDVTACAIVRDGVVAYPASLFWPKALMYCQIVEGDLTGAILGVDLLREGGDDDPTFFELVESAEEAAAGAGNDVEAADPTPLHMSLARATNQRVLPDDMSLAQPAVLAVLAASSNYDVTQRAEAAEWAVTFGSFPVEGLRELYAGFTFGNDELQAPIEAAALDTGVRGRALLFQAARQQSLPVARAEILNEAFRRFRDDGLSVAGNKAFLPFLTEIEPTPELLWFSEAAGRVLYMAGRIEQADAWATLAGRLAAINPRAKGAALGLWPYQRLAGAQVTALDQGVTLGVADWAPQRAAYLRDFVLPDAGESDVELPAEETGALSTRQIILLRALLDAVGENDALSWSDLALSGSWQAPDEAANQAEDEDIGGVADAVDPVVLLALDRAGRANRKGEAVLLSATAAADPARASQDLLAITTAVASLQRLGFAAEARALAMEAAESIGL